MQRFRLGQQLKTIMSIQENWIKMYRGVLNVEGDKDEQ